MTQPGAAQTRISPPQTRLTVDHAIHLAWWIWFVMLGVPFVLFLVVIWSLLSGVGPARRAGAADFWFALTMVYLAVSVPAALFCRNRLFKPYWSGKLVRPRDYLAGMIAIWSALAVGGLLAVIGCFVTGTVVPNVLPALLSFMLFSALWPNGQAMWHPLQDEPDPADYQEPH